MKNHKKIEIGKRIIQFDDIRQATEPKPEPPEELKETIPNGKRDEMIEKIISKNNEE